MFANVREEISAELDKIRADGLFKAERVIMSPQQASIRVQDGAEVLNLCANNYLGLADDPRIIAAAKDALDRWGYGLASVRFICGTQDVHKQLEQRISGFLGTEDTILYSSCFDRRLFERSWRQAVISDALNHAGSSTEYGPTDQAAALPQPRHGRPGNGGPARRPGASSPPTASSDRFGYVAPPAK